MESNAVIDSLNIHSDVRRYSCCPPNLWAIRDGIRSEGLIQIHDGAAWVTGKRVPRRIRQIEPKLAQGEHGSTGIQNPGEEIRLGRGKGDAIWKDHRPILLEISGGHRVWS